MELKVKGAIDHNKCYFIINEFIYYFYLINKDNEFEEGYFQFQDYENGAKIISLFTDLDVYEFFNKMKISDYSNTIQKVYYEGQYFSIKRKRLYNRQNNININDNFNRNNININNHIENNNNLNHHHHRQNHENNNNKNKMHNAQNNQRHNQNLNDIQNHNFGNNNNDKKDKWNNNKNNNNINMNNMNNNNLNHNMNMNNNLINNNNMMNINNMNKNNMINNNIINNFNNQRDAINNLFNQRNNNFKKNENILNNGNIFGFNQNNNNNRNNSPLLNNHLNNFNNINQNKKLNKRTKSANILKVNKFLFPSTKGLVNVGATCYMNATIQCLAHVSKLTKYLLNLKYINNNISDKNKYKLTNSYIEVLNNIWLNYNINYYSPDNFKNIISIMNPLFAGIQANDSKDLVLFMLETIHNELNEPNNNNQINGIQNQNQNQYDYETTFNLFKNYFTKNYNSIISNLFYGMYNSMMTCYTCNATTHNVQCFNILIFPLEEVRKYKNKLNNTVDIIECFEYYQKQDIMKNSNQIYCNNCKTMSICNNKTELIIGPNVLVINLNRGKGLEFNVKIDFEEYLDIKNFIYYKEESPSFYELIGIVTHFGPSSMSGHFIAFCKSFIDNQWYKYNDTQVNLSSFEEARSTGVPYILFYSFIKR